MKQALNNQRGSVLIMGLLVLVVLGGMLAAASPMIVNEVKLNMVNRDMIDAQFTAEAGAKAGIAAVYAKNADWTWLGKPKNLTTAEANKTYSVEIVDASTNTAISGAPVSGTTYKITSTGTVNGVSKKAVVSSLFSNAGGVFNYGAYSSGAMKIVSGSLTGNIASDGLITVGNGVTVNGKVSYTGVTPVIGGSIQGTPTKVSSIGTLDVNSLMRYTPAMPVFSMSGTVLPNSNLALSGAYNYVSNPTSGKYYKNSNFSNWSYLYTVAADQSIFIYVNGNYTIGTSITGGGNITIYATGNIETHGNIIGDTVKIYAGGNILLSEKTITGNTIVLQSAGNFNVSGGSVLSPDNGTVDIFSGGKFDIGAGSITGGVVTITATSASSKVDAVNLHGGNINSGKPGYITKIFAGGDVNLTSLTIGGASMIVATGSMDLHGMTSSAILIANGDIEAASGSAGGLYTNGSINSIHGASITYAPSAAGTLGIGGAGGADVSNLIWAQQ